MGVKVGDGTGYDFLSAVMRNCARGVGTEGNVYLLEGGRVRSFAGEEVTFFRFFFFCSFWQPWNAAK